MQTIIVKTVLILCLLEIIIALGNAAAVDATQPTGTFEERPYSGNPMACHQEGHLHNDMRCIQNDSNDDIVSSEPASPSLEERNWSINDEGYSEESRQDCIEAREESGNEEEVSSFNAHEVEPNNSRYQYNAPARDLYAASNTDQDEDLLNEQIHNSSNESDTKYSPEESSSINSSSLDEQNQDFTWKDLMMALSLITLMYIFSIVLTLGFLGIMGTIEAIRTPNDIAIHNHDSLNFQKDQYAIQIAWLFRWFRSAA